MMLMKWIGRTFLCAALVIACGEKAVASVSTPTAPTPTRQAITATMFGMPLQFEANQGQVDDTVKFLARGNGYTLFLTPTESVMVLSQEEVNAPIDDQFDEFMMSLTFVHPQQDVNAKVSDRTAGRLLLKMEQARMKQSVVRMKLEGGKVSPVIDRTSDSGH